MSSLAELVIKWDNLEGYDRLWKAFWPILSNRDKQEYYYKKHNTIICGDVDEMLGSFSAEIKLDVDKT